MIKALRKLGLPKGPLDKLEAFSQFQGGAASHELHGGYDSRMKMEGVERIKGYRYPSPGSQAQPTIPSTDVPDRLYDIQYYTRDTRRAPLQHSIMQGNSGGALGAGATGAASKALEVSDEADLGSPGLASGNPAVYRYDETGLRSAMTATNPELFKALAAVMPTHNVEYEWAADADKIVEEYTLKGIPPLPGRRMPMKVQPMAFEAGW